MISLLIVYLAGGTLLCLLAIPLIRRRIPRNGLYGFRVSRTMASDAVWYQTNEFAGKRLLAVGLVIVVVSVVLYAAPGISLEAYALSILFVVIVAFGIVMLQCARFLQSLPEETARP
jgi:uncharacterized membrane protein